MTEETTTPRKGLKRVPMRRKVSTISRGTKLRSTGQMKPNKKVLKRKSKAWKFVKSHLQECDDAFAREIKQRDGMCLFPDCGTTRNLTCSHYIGRANWNTRFDPDNCITLCQVHHFWDKMIGWEFQKQRKGVRGCDWDGRYTVFMQRFLGETRWNQLLERANGGKSRKDAILETQRRYNLRQPVDKPEEA